MTSFFSAFQPGTLNEFSCCYCPWVHVQTFGPQKRHEEWERLFSLRLSFRTFIHFLLSFIYWHKNSVTTQKAFVDQNSIWHFKTSSNPQNVQGKLRFRYLLFHLHFGSRYFLQIILNAFSYNFLISLHCDLLVVDFVTLFQSPIEVLQLYNRNHT